MAPVGRPDQYPAAFLRVDVNQPHSGAQTLFRVHNLEVPGAIIRFDCNGEQQVMDALLGFRVSGLELIVFESILQALRS